MHHRWLLTLAATLGCAVGALTAAAAYLRWERIERDMHASRPLSRPLAALPLVGVIVVCAVAAMVAVVVEAL